MSDFVPKQVKFRVPFTKAPWRADGLLVKCQKGHVIADTRCTGEIDIPLEECVENAKIIAAAPEMYDALGLVIKAFSGYSKAGQRVHMDDMCKAITEAVAKAEGRSL